MKTLSLVAISGLIAVALGACSAYPTVEADFGNSVRHMVSAQTVPSGPVDNSPVEGTDGQRANTVLESYRNDVTPSQQTPPQPIVLDFGSSTGQ